jgi:precorrin-6A/cobalt-precorrin-6A reductase
VLILGGTAEAHGLAARLHEAGVRVVTSLAGRVSQPRLTSGEVRIGSFGGSQGLRRWLAEHQIVAVVDGTHVYAVQISRSAADACAASQVPLLRIERPGWTERPGDRWTWVDDVEAAARAIVAMPGSRVLLTLGGQRLSAFAGVESSWLLIRCIEAPKPPLPLNHEILLDRGPFTLDGELDLIRQRGIDLIVSRDSGGGSTQAKLEAARGLGVPVVMVRRPPSAGGPCVADVDGAFQWVISAIHASVAHDGDVVGVAGRRSAAEPST